MTAASTWLFDAGNSRLKWARDDAFDRGVVDALALADVQDAPALDAAFASIRAGDNAWLASVAPDAATEALVAALARCGARVQRARTQAMCAGVRIAYADPGRLGVDRYLTLLAVHAMSPQPALVASIGTALTIDLLAADGQHVGGLIAPSPTLMRDALARISTRLPEEGGRLVDFATDTADALASGTLLAARALVARSLDAARRRLGMRVELWLTGGGAPAFGEGWRVRHHAAPHLVLRGLRIHAQAAPAAASRLD